MRNFLSRYNYFLLLVLIFIISEIIVNPIGDFPLNDDWSYGKSVLFNLQGNYTIGEFGAMTLFTHLMWGTLFAKIFGFSFTVLRISTLVSAVICMFFMNKLIIKISNNKLVGFLACLILLFNPLYFNLANTYMTDVNFNTILVLCCFCAYNFFETKKMHHYILFLLLSICLVLIRQFGIIVPICFMFGCFFIKEDKMRYLAYSIIAIAIVFISFKLYENYLERILPQGSSYKFSGGIKPLSTAFWKMFFDNFAIRYRTILLHILIYTSPFAVVYLISIAKTLKKNQVLFIVIICFSLSFLLFKEEKFPHHNVFINMSIGAETFHETLKAQLSHTYSSLFDNICYNVKWIFSGITLLVVTLFIVSSIKQKQSILKVQPEILFFISLLISYSFMILITESYFDRYHIPIITIVLLLFSYLHKKYQVKFKLSIIYLICFFYVSVFGTKDYFSLNRNRWEAVNFIKNKANVTSDKINGGFEVNCWNDGKGNWWYDYWGLTNFDFLIQFKKEDGFILLKEYEFQRYFPYKKDKINIFVREGKASEYQL